MSKIAREISKKASVVTLATVLAVQSIPVNAAEIEAANNLAVETNIVAEDKQNLEAKIEEAAPAVVETTKEEAVEEKSAVEDKKEVPAVTEVKEEPKNVVKAAYQESFKDEGDEIITFTDKNLEKSIREHSNISNIVVEKGYITRDYMKSLQWLKVEGKITNFEGLEYATQLERLYIDDVTGADLSGLNKLVTLQTLTIEFGSVDLKYISNLKSLAVLGLGEVPNENLDILKNFYLYELVIYNAKNLTDISAIKNMRDLSTLMIRGTESNKSPLTDISVIKNFNRLKMLDLSNTNVSDFNTIINASRYEYLKLSNCNISDISKLAEIEVNDIGIIWMDKNNISDPTAIFKRNYLIQNFINQTVTLPEIVTKAGDVTYKIPYGDYVTDVEIDENVGKYNPETKEIIFYNVTSSKNVTYKVRTQHGLNGEEIKLGEGVPPIGYDYSVVITQPIKVTNPIPVQETQAPEVVKGTTQTTTVNTVSDKTPKTGDVGAFGVLSLAVMSLAGAVKSRKRK